MMVIEPTTATPISSAVELAAVRFGFRMAFWRASAPASSHGRRCSGVAITAVSLRIAIGLSS